MMTGFLIGVAGYLTGQVLLSILILSDNGRRYGVAELIVRMVVLLIEFTLAAAAFGLLWDR